MLTITKVLLIVAALLGIASLIVSAIARKERDK